MLISSSAFGALLDFEGLPFNTVVAGDIVPIAGSTLTDEFSGDGVVFGRAGISAGVAVVRGSLAPSSGENSVGGMNSAGILPGAGLGGGLGDIFFSFVLPGTMTPSQTSFVSFTVGDAGGDIDIFEIRSYDLADNLIDIQNNSSSSRFAVLISVPGIHRVEVDFTGNFGYSLDDLEFPTPQGIVPEPATFIVSGLGLLAGVHLRRRIAFNRPVTARRPYLNI
jgi:hypothetical protein